MFVKAILYGKLISIHINTAIPNVIKNHYFDVNKTGNILVYCDYNMVNKTTPKLLKAELTMSDGNSESHS